MPRPATRPYRFHVCLDPTERDMLNSIATESAVPLGLIIRQCIRARYAMQFNDKPTCADGGRCHCPHLHAV